MNGFAPSMCTAAMNSGSTVFHNGEGVTRHCKKLVILLAIAIIIASASIFVFINMLLTEKGYTNEPLFINYGKYIMQSSIDYGSNGTLAFPLDALAMKRDVPLVFVKSDCGCVGLKNRQGNSINSGSTIDRTDGAYATIRPVQSPGKHTHKLVFVEGSDNGHADSKPISTQYVYLCYEVISDFCASPPLISFDGSDKFQFAIRLLGSSEVTDVKINNLPSWLKATSIVKEVACIPASNNNVGLTDSIYHIELTRSTIVDTGCDQGVISIQVQRSDYQSQHSIPYSYRSNLYASTYNLNFGIVKPSDKKERSVKVYSLKVTEVHFSLAIPDTRYTIRAIKIECAIANFDCLELSISFSCDEPGEWLNVLQVYANEISPLNRSIQLASLVKGD